ncbi:ribosome silencing factor [Thermodesulfobacterium hydrogeniphilum]|uniref:ribosome silencing factor n=1 Tax=Thermodesulfobacterium hydrogeniphilum TaxID=161156 RepID=UPI00056F8FB9|nr:ribosome silencing factor [Thermodesulfobacterium hydrogeniphilum]
MESKVLAEEILKLLESKKAEDIVLIDIRDKVDYADYLIICSAHSTKHTQGLTDFVIFELEKFGIKPLNIEGFELGQWIVIDFDSVIVHIFYEPIRKVYALEELWMDYPPSKKNFQNEAQKILQEQK